MRGALRRDPPGREEKGRGRPMASMIEEDGFRESVSACGRLLGVLFLERPSTEDARRAAAAILEHPLHEVWPFGEDADLTAASGLLVPGYGAAATDASAMKALDEEFQRLFIGPSAKVAPPWGSVYLDRDCVVFGVSCLQLRAWMRANGVQSLYPEKEPEDHIGRMLVLMATLADERPELLGDFLSAHLLTWSGHFLDVLEAGTDDAFFRGLALLTRTTLDDISELLELQVPVRKFYR